MRNILLILACVATVATSASAYSIKEKDRNCDESRNRWIAKASEIIQQKETALFEYFYRKYPSESISVSGLLDILLKTLHILHKPHDSERKLKSLGFENIEQAKEITRFIVDQIAQSSNVYQNYEVYADVSKVFTNTFINNFADLCRGETKYIDYNNNREADSFMNKWYSSPENQDDGIRDRCFKKNGVVFSAELKLIFSYDNNIDNTLRNTYINYHLNNGLVWRRPALRGIFDVLYVEDNELNAQYIKISINNGDGHVIFGLPHNSKDLPLVVEKLCNNTRRNILVNSMKRMQVEITSVRGAAFMKNSLKQYFIKEGVNLNGYNNVLKGTSANVNDILQNINITLKRIQSQGNSSLYQRNNKFSTKFVIDRAVAYKIVLTKYNIPYGFGVYDFNEHGEFQ